MNLDDDITTATSFLGTTRYSSPEYLLREGEEESTDGWRALTFYQLGGLLHDMIMRRRLFDEIDAPPARLTDAVRYEDPLIESDEVPSRLVGMARSCLQKDWKLRLKLTSWNSFAQVQLEPDIKVTEAEIAERIGVRASSGPARPKERETGSRRRAIQRVRSRISTTLGQQCTDAGIFPPIRVDGVDNPENNSTEIVLQTGPSTTHAISRLLVVKLDTTILDFRAMHIGIVGIAGVGTVNFDHEEQGLVKVFVGELDSEELGERLRRFAVKALDAAQRQVTFSKSQVLVVEWEHQGC